MATLVDHQIAKLAQESSLITAYAPEQQNPASYDVRLGSLIRIELRQSSPGEKYQIINIGQKPYMMSPGEFVLAHTDEAIMLPSNIEAVFYLKSSRGREGYNHMLATYCDPGFRGQITLELQNANRFNPLPLYAGLRIGQLRFARLDDTPLLDYGQTGRYQDQLGIVESKG